MRPKLRHPMQKILWVMLFAALLTSCAQKDTQYFIFKKYNSTIDNWDYYKANLYNPSQIEAISIIPCSEDKRDQPFWSPNGIYYVCLASYNRPFLIYDVHNSIIAKIDQGNPESPDIWYISGWSPDSQHISIIKLRSPEKPYYDFSVMKYDGTELLQLGKQSIPTIGGGEWSPNGKLIAYQIYTSGKVSVILFQPSGEEVRRFDLLEYEDSPTIDMKWSPDSKKLAFRSNYNIVSNSKLYVLDIETGKLTNIISDKSVCVMDIFDWSPDSQKILFGAINCKEHIGGDIFDRISYSINVDGSELKALTEKGSSTSHWTLDGKSIIFDRYDQQGIYSMNVDGSNKRKLLDNAYFVSWIKH